MQSCSSYHGHIEGHCSCGEFHSQSNNDYSTMFTAPNQYAYDEEEICPYNSYSYNSSSSVDCTLSLGTPSTRLSNDSGKGVQHERRRSNYMPNFCWDILQKSKNTDTRKTNRGNSSNNANSGGDSLLARRCANCDTTSTPLWRNGPRGPKSLCNACGIRFKKEERRAAASTTTTNGGAVVDSQHMINSSWVHHQSQTQKNPYHSFGNEYMFIDEYRPSLLHDFTL